MANQQVNQSKAAASKPASNTIKPSAPLEASKFIDEDDGSVVLESNILSSDIPDIEIESNLYDASATAEELAFLEEPVTIEIAPGQDENNPEPFVFLSINGVGAGPMGIPYVPRGMPVTVKRKYVEVLARARPITYGNMERTNEKGERYMEYPRKSSLKYPFTVIEDRSPRGQTWLRRVLAER